MLVFRFRFGKSRYRSCIVRHSLSCPVAWEKHEIIHTCHKLRTEIREIRQNFKGELTKYCEVFLNITLELPQYSSLFFFFHVRSLWKQQHCVIFVYFFIKSVVNWSENSVRFEQFMGTVFQISAYMCRKYYSFPSSPFIAIHRNTGTHRNTLVITGTHFKFLFYIIKICFYNLISVYL